MTEYIEREAARQAHIKASLTTRLIDAIPAADVVPVRHGRWIVTDVVTCSECQHFTRSEFAGRWKYCPNCGALMMEVENGEK